MEHFYKNIRGWCTFQKLYSDMVANGESGDIFVELGAFNGQSAAYMAVEIINSKKDIKFYCIDTWLSHDNTLDMFLQHTRPVKDYIIPIKGSSLIEVDQFKDNSLKFVFIDSSHEYDDVKNELEKWYPKIKAGGVLAGHDYHHQGLWAGVGKAVDEFCEKNNIKLTPIGQLSWCIQK